MRMVVSNRYQKVLARSAAIIAVTVATGCSSDVARFQDSFLPGASRSATQTAAVDYTQTGTVAQNGSRGAPMPNGDVGNGGYQAPMQQAAVSPGQPYPQGTPSGPQSVARDTLPPVGQQQASLPAQTQTGSGFNGLTGQTVTVREGDTLSAIASRHGVPVALLVEGNNLRDASAIRIGQQLRIPSGGSSPAPGQQERVAVLPQPTQSNERAGASQTPTNATGTGIAPSGNSYTVVAGDTLNGIARKTGVSADALKSANGLSNGLIRIGQTLTIPAGGQAPATTTQVAARQPTVDPQPTGSTPTQNNGNGSASAYTPPQSAPSTTVEREAEQQVAAATPGTTGISSLRWPVNGRVISNFGSSQNGRPNDGIDIAVPTGTPIKAAENGVVIFAGPGLRDFGNTVLVRHDDGMVTVYGHASEISVSRGDTVRRGQDIAISGMTGSAETPMVHFEVRKDSRPVNPATYLQ